MPLNKAILMLTHPIMIKQEVSNSTSNMVYLTPLSMLSNTSKTSKRSKNKKAKTQLMSSQSKRRLISWLNFQKCSKVNSHLLKEELCSLTKSLTICSILTEACSSPKVSLFFIFFHHNHFFISNRKPERASKNIDGDPSKLD